MTIRIGGTSAGAMAQRWLIAIVVGLLVMAGTTTFAAAGPILVGLASFSEVAVTGLDRATDSKSGLF